MLIKYYVGHEVVLKKTLVKYGLKADLIGCHFNNYYFISRKAVLLRRDGEGNYLYSNSGEKCIVIDPNNLIPSVAILECNSCIMRNDDSMDCKSMKDVPDEFVGVVGIRPIASFDRDTSWFECLGLVEKYNNKVQEEVQTGIQSEYVCVTDTEYPDFIRIIDDDIKQIIYNKKDIKLRVKSVSDN